MKKILLLALAFITTASATTLELVKVFQPLSLHGTDMALEFEGEDVQAAVRSVPMVLSGAMPEALIDSIAKPHKLQSSENYKIPEANLLVLYNVTLNAELKEGEIVITFDVSKLKVPQKVDLSIITVVKLGIKAVKMSLAEFHHPESEPILCRIAITGTTDSNKGLKSLSEKFTVKE